MGVLRSVPQKAENCSLQDLSKYFCVTASVCGWQLFMEDFDFSFQYSQSVHVMGILDGQAGPEVAEFCQSYIQQIITDCELMKLEQYQAAIQNICFTLDERIKQNHIKINKIRQTYNIPQLPSTEEFPASASLIICIIDEESVTIGNLGECKSYISYKNSQQTFVLISGNHVIERDDDIDSINKKGGFVVDNLVNGKFLQSKTIGNLKYKNLNHESKSLISSQPSVFTLRLEDLNAIVMGSSGLWERPETVLRLIFEQKMNPLEQKQNIKNIIQNLIAQSPQDEYGKQNITVKALFFNHQNNNLK